MSGPAACVSGFAGCHGLPRSSQGDEETLQRYASSYGVRVEYGHVRVRQKNPDTTEIPSLRALVQKCPGVRIFLKTLRGRKREEEGDRKGGERFGAEPGHPDTMARTPVLACSCGVRVLWRTRTLTRTWLWVDTSMKKPTLAKRRANPNSSYWRNKADAAWSLVVRAPGRCLVCGSPDHLQAHHLVSRVVLPLRHEPLNGVCLCSKHHCFDRRISGHRSPFGLAWLLERQSPQQWAWLMGIFASWDAVVARPVNFQQAYLTLLTLQANLPVTA